MNKTKIKSDKHGLYVRTNGTIYRPQTSINSYPTPYNNWGDGIESVMKEGDVVKVGAINQTPFCKIVKNKTEERWNMHESLEKSKNSETYWLPAKSKGLYG